MENIEFIWESVKNRLKEKYDENTFNEHFGAILGVHKFSNGFLYLIVTNDFAKYRLLKFYQNARKPFSFRSFQLNNACKKERKVLLLLLLLKLLYIHRYDLHI